MGAMRASLRKPPAAKVVELTARDQAIIWRAHEFRFITTNQIERFTGSRSRNKLNDRLRDLWAADYLTRPAIQREVYAYRDRRETVHALGQAGARWLRETHGVEFPNGKGFTAANAIKSGAFMEHEIGVGDVMLAFPPAVAAHGGLRFREQGDVVRQVQASARQPSTYPLTLASVIRWPNGRREEVGTKPDYVFYLIDERGERERKALFFLEYENTRKDFAKLLAKYLKYSDIYRRRLHTERFGSRYFRVLFVIDGDEAYLELFLSVYRNHIAADCPPAMFLHTTRDAYAAAGPFAPIWRDGAGEIARLVEPA